MELSCAFTLFSVARNVLILTPTYAAVVFATTMSASAFAAAEVFNGFAPVTVSEISGVDRVAPAPVAVRYLCRPRRDRGALPGACRRDLPPEPGPRPS